MRTFMILLAGPSVPVTQSISPYTTHEDFFFRTPPYTELQMGKAHMQALFTHVMGVKMDGYCPHCRQMRTFDRANGSQTPDWIAAHGPEGESADLDSISWKCTRHGNHRLIFEFHIYKGRLQKIGQWPSFADIALDESKDYSKLLTKQDAAEFHKAIGLAAHNVGIGSYVYLRRIFERIIVNRFEEFKASEGWSNDQFYGGRMEDKISLLKNHLPAFLVKNARIYSILSLGIHELEEEQCLGFFRVLRQSLILILEQDKKLKEELDLQKQLEKEIAGFEHPPKPEEKASTMSLAELGKAYSVPGKG